MSVALNPGRDPGLRRIRGLSEDQMGGSPAAAAPRRRMTKQPARRAKSGSGLSRLPGLYEK